MKKVILLLITLFSVLSSVFSQSYFTSQYGSSGADTVASDYIRVKYHNHQNPVKYVIVLGSDYNFNGDYYDVSHDSIIYGDSVANILISETGAMNQVSNAFFAYKAYAIDSITLDTLGVLKSKQLQSTQSNQGWFSVLDLDFDQVNSPVVPSQCYGSYEFSSLLSLFPPWSNQLISNQLIYNENFTSYRDSMTTIFIEDNINDISQYPNFNEDSLCPGYYELICSKGFIISFTILGTPINLLDSTNITISESPYVECYNSAIVSVNHNSGPFTYSWDEGLFDSNSVKEELCSGAHSLRVANSSGDTVVLNPFIHTLSSISTVSTLNSCLGKSKIRIDSNSLDASNFQYSWSGADFTSENNTDSLCPGNHSLLIIDNFGDTLIQYFSIDILDFYLGTYSDSNSCNGSAYFLPEGDPFAFLPIAGGDSLYISWNHMPFELYDMENQSIDSLCEGIYSVSITGDVTGNDTLVFPFAIASSSNTFNNIGSAFANGSVSYYVDDCSIDYSTTIDSASISSFNYIDSVNVIYTVDVWQQGQFTQLSDTVLCYLDSVNFLNVSFTFYCSLKSNSEVFKVVNIVSLENGETVSSITEKKEISISVFPNPSRGQITINSNSDEPFQIYLYNSNAQLVLKGEEKVLKLNDLAKGIYILHYVSNDRSEIHKIIKE